MVGRMRRLVIASTLAGSLAACSYIFHLPAQREADADASTDAGVHVEGDGEADSEAAAPASSSGSFCATHTPSLYCEDFDGTPPPNLASVGTVSTKDGTVAVDETTFLSAPAALRTSVIGTGSIATFTHALNGTPEGVTLSFDMLVSAWNTPRAQLASIKLEGAGSCQFQLLADTTNYAVVQDCTTESIPTSTQRNVDVGHWHRFSLSIRFQPKATVTFTFDGAAVVDAAALPAIQPSRTSVSLGFAFANSGSAVLFHDNVLVTSP
jgi:hypothetical protein